jgi:two-component system response regulator FlrC
VIQRDPLEVQNLPVFGYKMKTIVETDEDGLKLMSLKDAEKLLIKKALVYTSENRTQAAKILGVSIRTLRNKINEYRSEGTTYFVNLR